MHKLVTIMLYLLWTISLIGILVVTFSNFQYEDLNLLVALIFLFTIINTLFVMKRR